MRFTLATIVYRGILISTSDKRIEEDGEHE